MAVELKHRVDAFGRGLVGRVLVARDGGGKLDGKELVDERDGLRALAVTLLDL